jgi:hypothetical protein
MAAPKSMEAPETNYRSEFLRSPHHVVFGLMTLGAGFMSGHILPLIIGGTIYAVGWVHLPDMAFFRNWVDRRQEGERQAAALAEVQSFTQRRDRMLDALSTDRRQRYELLARVCKDIEVASAENPVLTDDQSKDPRLRKLDELMWTYLRLLSIEESLERFLEAERREDLPHVIKDSEAEVARLSAELDELKAKGPSAAFETRQRYLGSRFERLEVLKKRQERISESQDNLALVISEQERLDQQIKLIRADAIAMKNAESLTARIDATVQHLGETNKWLSEMDQFKDLVGDMPATELRIGYNPAGVPPILPNQRQGTPRPRVAQERKV